ncbi:hypothetical protein KPL70_018014 [Citrus sinensis]|nr:hypothetical protein KPL70_018014 [Citrus sinensis]
MFAMPFYMDTLKEDVYMEQPPGFIDSSKLSYVCKLHKSLYGLKQAPRAWFECLSQALLDLGFKCRNNSTVIQDIITTLGSQFALKDLGKLSYFLGIEIKDFNKGIFLSQAKYTTDLLAKAKMENCTPISTPMAVKEVISPTNREPVNPTEYRTLVGSLQYLTFSRPDITHAVNRVCQHFQNPTKADLRAIKRILHQAQHDQILCLLGCKTANCVSWSSKKQTTVARSSAEAEYRSIAFAAAELTWITFLLHDLGIPIHQPPTLLCDNLSAVYLTKNPAFHARTKHIELDFHFVREKVSQGLLITTHISSAKQVADIFTKPLPKAMFSGFRYKLGIHSMAIPSLRGADKSTNPNISNQS